ncbi:tetraacyldisaccharide 4'-kinase [Thalassotalea castellviae]|uniref:Tetraacyldisaccharide 4'-kinase n=1 Tax=Thalassotalea castellviae TaxID=3075612 RepID=A0ABU2ZX30_9GAMM|nr:tetraacyldisaccharide 4'-kinase [Thalassotalea sp. W431]MDT0602485.1 tetraacyldisaccharide 4'-kinase [Thalassotalea sp. W431]
MRLIEKVWFQGHAAKWWLVPLMLPLSILFWGVSVFRRLLFSLGIKKSIRLNCPVVVVGNIGVGGNGKTPVVLFLVEQLLKQGIKVGVLSRGYGGKAPYYPYLLTEQSTAREAGDEPILIYQRCQVPVVVGADRIAAAKQLIELGCQIIISDDGLQHYRLKRDYELLVVDGNRLFGNGLLLPAGPLRETTQRLNSVDGIIVNGVKSLDGCERVNDSLIKSKTVKHFMQLSARRIVNVKSGEVIELANFIQAQPKVNALAGIGDPQRFFSYVAELGFSLNKQQGFVDHQAYQPSLFDDIDQPIYPENTEQIENDHHKIPLLMTEKDAVKCTEFAQDHWWYLPVDACFTEQSKALLITELMSLLNPTK